MGAIRLVSLTAIAACLLAGAPALAQAPAKKPAAAAPAKTPPAATPAKPAQTYLEQAMAAGEKTGVAYADSKEDVAGPKTIAGKTSYQSPLPYFKDLKPWDPAYKAPLAADGHPDLQGVWSTASLTTMTRGGNGDKVGIDLVIPAEKIAETTKNAAYSRAAADSQKRTDPKAGLYTDKNAEAGYNAFWIDPGSEYAKVNTEYRTSWITSPANGQVPFSKEGMALRSQRMTNFKTVKNTGPEIRPLGERCLISFGSQGGPPLNNAMYNNNMQIVQTANSVLIDIEMNHDARVINIAGKSGVGERPAALKQWFGDEDRPLGG